jgi:hypothetical protein
MLQALPISFFLRYGSLKQKVINVMTNNDHKSNISSPYTNDQ